MKEKEIQKLSIDELAAINPFERKWCYDCRFTEYNPEFCCINADAVKKRQTNETGVVKCEYWRPDWGLIDDKYKDEEFGYIKSKKNIFCILKEKFKNIFNS